jgi:hypothetical protein
LHAEPADTKHGVPTLLISLTLALFALAFLCCSAVKTAVWLPDLLRWLLPLLVALLRPEAPAA